MNDLDKIFYLLIGLMMGSIVAVAIIEVAIRYHADRTIEKITMEIIKRYK